jgi:hypothetical protein
MELEISRAVRIQRNVDLWLPLSNDEHVAAGERVCIKLYENRNLTAAAGGWNKSS